MTVWGFGTSPREEAEGAPHYTDDDVRKIREGLETIIRIQARSAAALPTQSREFSSSQVELLTAAYSMIAEINEAVAEFPWKPWRKADAHVSSGAVADEVADILHFFGWWIRVMGRFNPNITAEALAIGFVEKAKVNDLRFAGRVAGREPPSVS